MRLATWNINGMNARSAFLLRWLEEVKPDVVGLQELKMTDDKFPRELLQEAGYHAAVHGQKSWNGVAVLTREPVEVTCVGLPGQEEMGARLITVDIPAASPAVPGAVPGAISFTTVYCPNGKSVDHDDFPRKLAFFDALLTHFTERHKPDQPTILCGDFNIAPAAIDSWGGEAKNGQLFHTDAERTRYQRLLDWGLRDTFREKFPEEPGFTWWDYRGGAFHKKQGLRIDVMLATASIADRIREVHAERDWRKKIDGMIPSDHIPVWLDIA